MSMSLAYRRYVLAPGETFALPTVPGALVRVIDGLVWATTSNGLADIWLTQGEEHQVETCGLTVIEASKPSVVELLPPLPASNRGRRLSMVLLAVLAWLHQHRLLPGTILNPGC
jgi:hypothetical protein